MANASATNGGDAATAAAAAAAAAGSGASSSPHRRGANAVTFSNTISEQAEKSPSLISLLGLTAYQQQQLAQSWPRIQRSGGHTAGAEIFRKLALKCPPVKDIFQKVNIVGRFARPPGWDIYKEHGKWLFEVLALAIKSLNESTSDDLIDLCSQFGAKHSTLKSSGFQNRMWDDFSELLVEHIARNEAVRGRRESVRAWTTLIMFIVDKMKDGYDCGLRKLATQVQQPASQSHAQQQQLNATEFEEARTMCMDASSQSAKATALVDGGPNTAL